jgi:SCY1-like protein 1
MFAKLTALVGGGYTFPYTVEEAYATCWGGWSHHRGSSKEDGSAVSVFKFQASEASDPKLAAARNGVKRLKMVRARAAARSATRAAFRTRR